MAGGVVSSAVESGAEASVVVMTNGDLDCLHDGLVRERESVAALSMLGLPESRIFFLGYPDGGLARLGRSVLPPMKRIIAGACVKGATTYGGRGFGGRDYHRAQFGVAASYTQHHAVADLVSILDRLRPTDIVITHPADTHPDHTATYALFRSALDRVSWTAWAPRVHRAMVHNGDCWPTGTEEREPCPPGRLAPNEPTPPLSGRLRGYVSTERLAVPPSCVSLDRALNPKVRAIAAHASQTRGSWESYLFSFARRDEAFYPETLVRVGDHWQRSDVPHAASSSTVLRLSAESLGDGGAWPAPIPWAADTPSAASGRGAMGPDGSTVAAAARALPGSAAADPVRFEAPRSVAHEAPFSLSAELLRPRPTAQGSVARFEILADPTGHYALTVDADRRVAALTRHFEGRPPLAMQDWLLPHDMWSGEGVERVELSVELRPEDGGVAELSLWCRGDLVGVAVDPAPRLRGDAIVLANVATTDGTLALRAAPISPTLPLPAP